MEHKYRTRIQGEALQKKIRDTEWSFVDILYYPLSFGLLTIFAWLTTIGVLVFNWISAILFSLITVILSIRAYKKFRKAKDTLSKYRKGLEGERFVGELLNKMSSDSIRVFHDIPGDRFNVDHIIVSTCGVFVIETKHFDRTKGHEFYFDGNMIQRKMPNGKIVLCPKLLPQMDGEARFIHDEIKRRTEMDIHVIKVAIIIGCYIHVPSENNIKQYFDKYWITNERLFEKMFKEEKEIYDDSVVKLISTHMNEFVKIDID